MTDALPPLGRRRVLILSLLPVLASCGAGNPTYYTLQMWPGPVRRFGPSTIEIRTPSVASFLDRDYIVEATRDYHLELAGNDAWAEPIGDMIARVLASDLAQRCPDATVFRAGSAIGSTPSVLVELVIDRFDKNASGEAVVHATLAVHPPLVGPTSSETITLSERPAGSDTSALVASLSRMLGGIADHAVEKIAQLRPAPNDFG